MRFTQRCLVVITVAIAGLAATAATTAAAPSEYPVRGTVQAVKGCVKVTATIRVGHGPDTVAANPKTNTIYVANFSGGTVSVISGRTNTVTATIPVGGGADGIETNPKTNTIYVARDIDN